MTAYHFDHIHFVYKKGMERKESNFTQLEGKNTKKLGNCNIVI